MKAELQRQIETLSEQPGVYLFADGRGKIIYVGKAKRVRTRVRQYLTGHDERLLVPKLVRAAASVEAVVTHTEKEALILENSLIKKHQPRYNIQLRDDKNFLHLRLDSKGAWPRYTLVRRIGDDGARYFGPYASASRARHTEVFLQRAFLLRSCSDHVLNNRKRACLLHQMKRCSAPCVDGIDAESYGALLQESRLFLEGKTTGLLKRLRKRMKQAATHEAFEEAARLRDLIFDLEGSLERQRIVDPKRADRDVWGLHREDNKGAVALLAVRAGVVGQPSVVLLQGLSEDDGELLSSLLNTAYPVGTTIPPEILVPVLPPDAEALQELLSERRGKRVVLRRPARGDKRALVELASLNARAVYDRENTQASRIEQGLQSLAELLGLPEPPARIECFDNSNIGGQHPVAAMSVFIDGKPARAHYRRYRVKTVQGADDYATMREILWRRLKRGLQEDNLADLMVVDGGKGQLGVAVAVLADLGLKVPVVGIAKPHALKKAGQTNATDRIFVPQYKEALSLRDGHAGLRILQHARDEVHKHAITYHRKVRRKSTLSSLLEGIDGVGPGRRKALLQHFGSAKAVATASVQELRQAPGVGPALAQSIHQAFRRRSSL